MRAIRIAEDHIQQSIEMSSVETPFKLACRLFNQGYALKRNFIALLKDSVKEGGYGMAFRMMIMVRLRP